MFLPEIVETPIGEQLVSPQGEQLLTVMSDAYARGDGYNVEFVVDSQLDTFATSCTTDEAGKILVHVSPELLKRAEAEERLDFLGFAVLHELGHVKRFQAQPPKGEQSAKDGYFNNIVDDIAINYGNAKRTRFVHNMTKQVYDNYLFPRDTRPSLASDPRHKQFMESLLVLSMTTNAHVKADAPKLLAQANLPNLDPAVIDAISAVLAHEQGNKTYNLLGQLRKFGDSLKDTAQVASIIRKHFDALYEEDTSPQQSQPGEGQSKGEPSDGQGNGETGEGTPSQDQSSSGATENAEPTFDYSDSAGCGHGNPHKEPAKPDAKPNKAEDNKKNGDDPAASKPKSDPAKPEVGSNPDASLDISAIAENIADAIKEVLPDPQKDTQDKARNYTPEQLARFRTELGLDEVDFADYMAARAKFANEIRALEDILLQLRHDRQNEFLAPGREVAARGHRINVGKLVRAIASQALADQPDIWKHPTMQERIEHEYDGLDMYLLCDVSKSMAGIKAEGAAGASVVLEEGLLGSSAQMAGEQTPVVRLQIQAFGEGHEMLSALTDAPTIKDLGRTFSSLKNPTSGDTLVSEALSVIKPETGRLSVVVVLSDGAFHDDDLAIKEGQKLAEQNAAIIQMVFGSAKVSKLSEDAHRINLASAEELPEQLLNLLPELIETLRRSTHA